MDREERILMWVVALAMFLGQLGAYAALAVGKAYGAEPKSAAGEEAMGSEKLWSQNYNQAKQYLKKGKLDAALASSEAAMEEGGQNDPVVRIFRARIFYQKLDIARTMEEAVAAVQLCSQDKKDKKIAAIAEEAEVLLAEIRKFYAPVKIIPAPGFPDMFVCDIVNMKKKKVVEAVQERVRSGRDTAPWNAYLPMGEVCRAGNITIEVKSAEAGKEPSIPVPVFTATAGVVAEEGGLRSWNLSLFGAFTDGVPLGLSGRWDVFSWEYGGVGLELGGMYTMMDMEYAIKRLGEADILIKARLGPEGFHADIGAGGAAVFVEGSSLGWTAVGALGSTVHGWTVEMQFRMTGTSDYTYWLAPLCAGYGF